MAIAFNNQDFNKVKESSHITNFQVGDTITVSTRIEESGKTRTQKYKGIVIRISGREENKMFTVRHLGPGNVGVERAWPFISPWIQEVKVERTGNPRRSKLYYLRDRIGKRATNVRQRFKTVK